MMLMKSVTFAALLIQLQFQPSRSRSRSTLTQEEQEYHIINTSKSIDTRESKDKSNSTIRRLKAKKKGKKRTPSPITSPSSSSPTSAAPTMCEDNPNRFYVPNTGGKDMRKCDWVNRKPGKQKYPWRCRSYPQAAANCRVSCGTCPSQSPTFIPSVSPTTTPACTSDTISCDEDGANCIRLGRGGYREIGPVGETSCSDLTSSIIQSFTPIVGTPGSELLDISCTAHAFEVVDLGFDFQWLGGGGTGTTPVKQILVDTNGQINLNLNNLETKKCRQDHITSHGFPRIAIAFSDYHPEIFGDIAVCKSQDSIVVSFEEMNLGFGFITNTANMQAQLFADGRITICIGESTFASTKCAISVVSGIEGGVNDPTFPFGPTVNYTLPDPTFNIYGRSYPWPEPACYLFVPGSNGFVKV